MKLQYNGRVSEKGEMFILQKSKLEQDLQFFKDQDITITIERKTKKVSNKQRGYWYKVILPWLKKGYSNIGYNYTMKQIENLSFEMFMYDEVITDDGLEVVPLNFTQPIPHKVFSNAVDRAKIFAAENLDTYIPDANETIKPT